MILASGAVAGMCADAGYRPGPAGQGQRRRCRGAGAGGGKLRGGQGRHAGFEAGRGVVPQGRRKRATWPARFIWPRSIATEARAFPATWRRPRPGIARPPSRETRDAQGTLGLLYSIGQGVPHSDVEAYYWLDLAAAVKGPNQEKYAANRQMIGTHITATSWPRSCRSAWPNGWPRIRAA
jgi:hypothetical protein